MARRSLMVLAAMLALAGLPATAKTMNVQVRNGQVRTTPSFLGQIVSPVNYGQALDVVAAQSPWMQVRLPDGRQGWIHESALSAKAVTMQAGQQTVAMGASGDELALAGKGFSADVEAAFRAQNRAIDFSWVDRMEKMAVSPETMVEFLRTGGVVAQGGAR